MESASVMEKAEASSRNTADATSWRKNTMDDIGGEPRLQKGSGQFFELWGQHSPSITYLWRTKNLNPRLLPLAA